MSILVTGGTGYIGSHLSVELLNNGYQVIIVDNLSNSKEKILNKIEELGKNGFEFYNINLLNKDELDSVFEENKIDGVIHLAGYKSVSESVSNPLIYYQNNIISTLNLCESMNKYNVKNLVISSTATVYGLYNNSPLTEDMPLNPTNPYGRTKLIMEQLLFDLYASNNKWNITILRYFNPIGAHESGQIGEDPKGIPNNLMPYITQVAIGIRNKLNVFGNDYDTHDGTGVRDYIHVVDLAKGHIRALERQENIPGIAVYNLGTGKGVSVLDLVNNFEDTNKIKIPYQIVGRRPGDVAISYSSVEKAKKQLGWKSEKDIAQMCHDSWKWQKMNPNGII